MLRTWDGDTVVSTDSKVTSTNETGSLSPTTEGALEFGVHEFVAVARVFKGQEMDFEEGHGPRRRRWALFGDDDERLEYLIVGTS